MAKVYVQASLHEAFGCSLAEAMLCECIPVVSRNGAIPEVVGDTGVYFDKLDPGEVAKGIIKALSMSSAYEKKARERIINEYPLEKRKILLLNTLEGLKL